MQQTRDIKRRIRSIENTKQITRAMKMVAAAKLRRAQQRMLAMRPYAERLEQTLRRLAVDLVGDEHPLFTQREPRRVATLVIAGDRGLCGGFNTNILRAANQHLADQSDRAHVLFAMGKRAILKLRKGPHELAKAYTDVFEKLSYVQAGDICDQLVHLYGESEEKRIDEAYVVYNEFVTTMSQRPRVRKILPVEFARFAAKEKEEAEEAEGPRPFYEVEPTTETALARLVGRLLATQVHQATLESRAAELAARMTAMDNATSNAEDTIRDLTMDYNRARQAGITAELMDIVGGANALE
jgi:F-type H+-transporting ATPase subunit gamma